MAESESIDVETPDREEAVSLRRRVAELEARNAALEDAERRRLQVEDELRESRELYRALVETAFAGIAITDAEENLLYANPALCEIMGYALDELVGANLSRFVESQEYDRFQGLTEQRFQGLRSSYETHVYRKDGTMLNVLISASALTDGEGGADRVLAVVFDITELRRAEAELERNKRAYTDQLEMMVQERTRQLEEAHAKLIQVEKLAAVGRLAAGVAHEINNPAGVLLMKLKFLLSVAEREQLTEKAVATVNIAVEQTERITRIVQDLLNFSRRPAGQPLPLDLNECVRSSLRLARRLLADRRIDPVVDLGDDLPQALGDPVEFEQVLINLLNNAVEAMGEGDGLRLASYRDGAQVVVSVRDTGKGIRAEDIDSIFDPFFTTKPLGEGTGLGLSISYGIVQKMGGQIEVESREGEGATFRVVLPVGGA